MSDIPLSDRLVAMLRKEVEAVEEIADTFGLERIAVLAATIRDLELAAMAGAIRLSTQTIAAAVVQNLAKTQTDVAEALTSVKAIFGGGPADAPTPPGPCKFCGEPSLLWRIVAGEQVRVCLDHATEDVA